MNYNPWAEKVTFSILLLYNIPKASWDCLTSNYYLRRKQTKPMILNIATMLPLFSRAIVKQKLSWGNSWQNDRYQKAHPASVMEASPPVASVNILTCLPPSKRHLIRSKNKHKNIIKHSLCLTTLKLCASNLLHKWSVNIWLNSQHTYPHLCFWNKHSVSAQPLLFLSSS